MSIDDEDMCTTKDGRHDWIKIDDAEGDLTEAHLTRHFSWYQCTECGAEQEERPADYEEPFTEPLEWD